jgi:excisionase family DNA binding protein
MPQIPWGGMHVEILNPELVSVAHAAKYVGRHPDTLLRAIRRGDLPARNVRRGVPEYRLTLADVEAWFFVAEEPLC